jgi:protein-S-isoprenylcysteine O-methyltransferase Ste14
LAKVDVRFSPTAVLAPARESVRLGRLRRGRLETLAANAAGAAFAVYLLLPNLRFFLETQQPVSLVFAIQQAWVGVVFLIRRDPRTVSRRPRDWLVAYTAWFISFLVRPGIPQPALIAAFGLAVQLAGLGLWVWTFATLSRSYGIVAANRGLVTKGPYALVRHPLYAAYMVGGTGYLIQSPSIRNLLVDCSAIALQIIRITIEEQHLANPEYTRYRDRVRWRLIPRIW